LLGRPTTDAAESTLKLHAILRREAPPRPGTPRARRGKQASFAPGGASGPRAVGVPMGTNHVPKRASEVSPFVDVGEGFFKAQRGGRWAEPRA
jgi:hypothetical protein